MHSFNGVVIVILLMVLNVSNSLCMLSALCIYFYCTMDHCFLLCSCILRSCIYMLILCCTSVLVLVFSVPIELTNYKFVYSHVLSIAPPQGITEIVKVE